MNGGELIYEERVRQISEEGWTAEHDAEHTHGELPGAAIAYTAHAIYHRDAAELPNAFWPSEWAASWWKPSADPIRNLVKAGALIAAEIDRLQEAAKK